MMEAAAPPAAEPATNAPVGSGGVPPPAHLRRAMTSMLYYRPPRTQKVEADEDDTLTRAVSFGKSKLKIPDLELASWIEEKHTLLPPLLSLLVMVWVCLHPWTWQGWLKQEYVLGWCITTWSITIVLVPTFITWLLWSVVVHRLYHDLCAEDAKRRERRDAQAQGAQPQEPQQQQEVKQEGGGADKEAQAARREEEPQEQEEDSAGPIVDWWTELTPIEKGHSALVLVWVIVNTSVPHAIFEPTPALAALYGLLATTLVVLFAMTIGTLRSSVRSHPRRERVLFLTQLARDCRLLFFFHACCFIFSFVLTTSKPPITPSITRSKNLRHVCDPNVLTIEYIATNCTGVRIGPGASLPFYCRDGGWNEYRSRYDACLAASAVVELYSKTQSLLWLQVIALFWLTLRAFGRLGWSGGTEIPFVGGGAGGAGDALEQGRAGRGGGAAFEAPTKLLRVVQKLAQFFLAIPFSFVPLYLAVLLVGEPSGQPSLVATGIYYWIFQTINLVSAILAIGLYNWHVLAALVARLKLLLQGETAEQTVEFDCFLSHAWGRDDEGRDNHARVAQVNRALKAAGLVTWFDEERMAGNLTSQMTHGIDHSVVFVAFVTQSYITKAAGEGANGRDDNVFAEFDYGCRRKGVDKTLACLMEFSRSNAREWHGPVGFRLGGNLYHNLAADGDEFDEAVAILAASIKRIVAAEQDRRRPASTRAAPSTRRRLTSIFSNVRSRRGTTIGGATQADETGLWPGASSSSSSSSSNDQQHDQQHDQQQPPAATKARRGVTFANAPATAHDVEGSHLGDEPGRSGARSSRWPFYPGSSR